jgi:hypothetical protein
VLHVGGHALVDALSPRVRRLLLLLEPSDDLLVARVL